MCGILRVQMMMVAQRSPVQQLTTQSRYPTSQHPRSPCTAKCRRVSRDFSQQTSVDSRAYATRYAVGTRASVHQARLPDNLCRFCSLVQHTESCRCPSNTLNLRFACCSEHLGSAAEYSLHAGVQTAADSGPAERLMCIRPAHAW